MMPATHTFWHQSYVINTVLPALPDTNGQLVQQAKLNNSDNAGNVLVALLTADYIICELWSQALIRQQHYY